MSTLAERVQLCREKLGYSQREVAILAGLTQQGYQDIEGGKSKRPRNIEKLAEVLQTTPEFLQFGNKSTIPIHMLPLLNWDDVPLPPYLDIIDKKEGIIAMAAYKSGKWYALAIKDDSMTSKSGDQQSFIEGDIIIIDPMREPKHGSYVIVRQNETAEAILKQYLVHGNAIILSSLNDRYPSIMYDVNVTKICGVVIKKQADIVEFE